MGKNFEGSIYIDEKYIIQSIVNKYTNKRLIIVAATLNSGQRTYLASLLSVIGVKSGDTFSFNNILRCQFGIDIIASFEHVCTVVQRQYLGMGMSGEHIERSNIRMQYIK